MLIPLTALFATCPRSSVRALSSSWRTWRYAAKSACSARREKASEINTWGPPVVGLAVPHLERLALGAGHRQARNGHCLASRRLSPVLDLKGAARPTRPTRRFSRGSRSNPQDVPRESELGCTPRSRGVAQARHRHRRDQRQQIHGALPPTAVADLTHLPGESPATAGVHRLLYRADHSFPGSLCVSGVGPPSAFH